MENNFYATQRPSTLLASACAPSAAAPITAAPWASLSRAHQVQIQAELAQISVPGGMSGSKTSGFGGGNGVSVKQTDRGSGAPPRGRPV